jgi:two-component system sensor histidine kinase GlrK
MKVSSKIISGFLVLMLLSIAVVAYEVSVVYQMQAVNRELADVDVKAAATTLEMEKLVDLLDEYSKKYFGGLDPLYDKKTADYRDELLRDLGQLQKAGQSPGVRAEMEKVHEALESYWQVYNNLKEQHLDLEPDELPPDFTIALDHLRAQTEIAFESVKGSMKDQVTKAAARGARAEHVSWIAGILVLFLGIIVGGLLVQSINDPLRRLTHGTRAIAKGQFWHRLPAHGKDEFSELARDFNSMTERLGELDQMKKDFVSHVSHDLKAPLASIRQIMHLLLQEIPGSLNKQQKDLIRLSYNSAERLAAMVGNLLDVSRMEAGSMEYRIATTDIVPLIQSVTDEFDIQAREKRIRLRLDCGDGAVLADCDRDRIVQVIGNLYENALKFSPPDTEILTRVQRTDRGIVISVSDSGPGVPEGHKQRIFQKFHQVKHGKKVAGQGVGLGLAICKTIIEAHHGQIWVEDNPNGGSVFSFALKPAASEEVLKCGQPA